MTDGTYLPAIVTEVVRECPLCKHIFMFTWAMDGMFITDRCEKCGFVFMSLRPDAKFRKWLADRSQEKRFDGVKDKQREVQYQQDLDFLERFKPFMLTYNFANNPAPLNVLDVGCGNGRFLAEFKRRFPHNTKLHGIDISSSATVEASNNCRDGTFWCTDLVGFVPPVAYDLVVLRGIIEHIPDLTAFGEKLSNITTRDAWIFISATPNVNSLMAQRYKERWRLYQPEHINLWTADTLSFYLSRYGFKPIAFEYPYWQTPYADCTADMRVFFEDKEQGYQNISPPFWNSMMTAVFYRGEVDG